MKLRTSPARKALAGVTFVEVLAAVAIFMLLAGGIAGVVSIAVRAADEVAAAQMDSARKDAFIRFVRAVFLNLPPDASLELRIRQVAGKGDVVELLMTPAPAIADFGAFGEESDGVVLAAQPDGKGSYTMSITNFDGSLSENERDAELDDAVWLPLLPDVKTLRWRFGQQNGTPLVETWDANSGRPFMVDLELTNLDGTMLPLQFWIPQLKAARGGGPVAGSGETQDEPPGESDGGDLPQPPVVEVPR